MKVSTISHGVVLPANLQSESVEARGGKATREISQNTKRPVPAPQNSQVLETQAPIEPVINGQGLGLRFYLDRDTGMRVIEVVDEESGDVIRQIPPEEVVDFMRQFEASKGYFLSRRF